MLSTSSCSLQLFFFAISLGTYGSYACKSIPNALAILPTPCAILPYPISPKDLPDNSVPTNSFFAQIPSLNFLSAVVIFLQDAKR